MSKKPYRITITWQPNDSCYRVARIRPDGSEGMFVFYGTFPEALKHAEYFYSMGDAE